MSVLHSTQQFTMSVKHVVAFKSPSEDKRTLMVQGFLDLKDKCERDGKKYIVSITGGKQHSPEGKDLGMDVVFIMTFNSLEDRDFYISKDEAHKAFGSHCGPTYGVEEVVVFDFTADEY
ncbi:stress responsive A/B barrel domain-domain-containing protein [Kockovaella imperatae]|uniref:Stress responsive A/B barrel domain-domain-containing protein n=1 Tax=Kockovaella imperatae TaxID=4999 RepID=A0A1Y1UTL3_9TREE|nr:stress responsive A/B barrel domain-domain-containing protein [Kockovaella imperatae]ORX40947.1 stress responsive A/B barrel domain-domain-containing protein [Kockovaella imperatae]